MSLLEELKRRNVIRVGLAYAVVAWLVLQVADIVFEAIGTPEWVMQTLLVVLAIGLLFALFFAWAFELTPEGIKRENEVDRSQSIAPRTGRKLDFAIIGLLALALGYFVYESRFMDRPGASAPVSDPTENDLRVSDQEESAAPADLVAAAPAVIDERAIAVLPFANRSVREEDGFFTDGIHDDLLTQLAKIGDLKVISRTSVLQYKDTQKPIPEIARELRVGTILEGGVQRAGNRVRINAQLIDVVHDQHLWAETFDREMTVENIFDIQSEITRQIVQAVRGELTENEKATLAQVPTDDLEAYEAYLRAADLLTHPDYLPDNYMQAEFWARQAVERDPTFAQAWAQLVQTNGQAVWMGFDSSPARFEAARQALDNARQHGPELPETLAAEAEYQYRIEQDFGQAAATFKQAHEAAPGAADLLLRLGVAQRRTPDLEGALDSFRHSLELDPNNARVATIMVETLLQMGRLQQAFDLAAEWKLRDPGLQDMSAYQVMTAAYMGDLQTARALFNRLSPFHGTAYYEAALVLHFLERDFDGVVAMADGPIVQRAVVGRGWVGLDRLAKAWAFRLTGQEETARAEARLGIAAIQAMEPLATNNYAFELTNLGELMALAGDREGALAAIRSATQLLPERRDLFFGSLMAQQNARTLALVGERDRALTEIERLVDAPYPLSRWLLFLDPRWDFFRDDERFNELARPRDMAEAGP